MMDYMVIFVEGSTDNLFITKLFIEKLSFFEENYSIVEYSKKKDEKVNNYIESIRSIPGFDYVFITDQDGKENKREIIMREYNNIDKNKLFLSVYEIESWIIAGISDKLMQKYKIKSIPLDTSSFTKENFENIVPERLDKYEFISYILEDFDVSKALKSNSSLNALYEYFSKKNAS